MGTKLLADLCQICYGTPMAKENFIPVPSDEVCRRLIVDMGMMTHIIAHSLQVCRVSLFLADHLAVSGLNRELIRAAAHLHDITKTRSFKTHENHAATGGRLLTDLGYPEVGRIIAQHVRLDVYFATEMPTAAEIVNYADKRVLHDRVAPLSDRIAYILEKYGQNMAQRQEILKTWQKTERLEARLFAHLPFEPMDLGRLIAAQPFERASPED